MRFHLSNTDNLRVEFPDGRPRGPHALKPKGFWYDVDLDWIWWLEGEGYLDDERWMRPYLYKVFVVESCLLTVRDISNLDRLHNEYGTPWEMPLSGRCLDWGRVSQLYGGLEIAPYQWKRRFEPGYDWYDRWDCAGGVIWNPKALSAIELVATSKAEILELYSELKTDKEAL